MTPYDPDEDRHQSHERRLTDLETTHHPCPECGRVWNNPDSAGRCCDDD